MNKWEREVFLPKLEKKPMTDKEFAKVSREYDRNAHDVTRLAFNDIHSTVDTIVAINNLAHDSNLKLNVSREKNKLQKKWTKKGYLAELQSGPMSTSRFDNIMKNIASDNTRKFREEFDAQRNIANKIWEQADLV